MDWLQIFNASFALIFVLAMIGIVSMLLRKYVNNVKVDNRSKDEKGKIQIVETKIIDNKRKLVSVKNGDSEHLLLLSNDNEILIESKVSKDNPPEKA